jgi:hypothetical protein
MHVRRREVVFGHGALPMVFGPGIQGRPVQGPEHEQQRPGGVGRGDGNGAVAAGQGGAARTRSPVQSGSPQAGARHREPGGGPGVRGSGTFRDGLAPPFASSLGEGQAFPAGIDGGKRGRGDRGGGKSGRDQPGRRRLRELGDRAAFRGSVPPGFRHRPGRRLRPSLRDMVPVALGSAGAPSRVRAQQVPRRRDASGTGSDGTFRAHRRALAGHHPPHPPRPSRRGRRCAGSIPSEHGRRAVPRRGGGLAAHLELSTNSVGWEHGPESGCAWSASPGTWRVWIW